MDSTWRQRWPADACRPPCQNSLGLDFYRLAPGSHAVCEQVVLLETWPEPLPPEARQPLVGGVVAKPVIDPSLELVVTKRHQVRVGVDPQRGPGEKLEGGMRLERIFDIELGKHSGVGAACCHFVDCVRE